MGQISNPTESSIILSDVDRLVAENSASGMDPTSQHVIAFGQGAGNNMLGVDNVIVLGQNAGQGLNAVSDVIVLGRNSADNGIGLAGFNGSIVLGANTLRSLTTMASARNMIMIGRDAATDLVAGYGLVGIGNQVFQNVIGTTNNTGNTVAIGFQAASSSTLALTPGATRFNDGVYIGYQAGRRTAGAATNNSAINNRVVAIGYQAGSNYYPNGGNLEGSVLIGYQAGANSYGSNDVIIGDGARATTTASGSASSNVIIGSNAVTGGMNASSNVVIGSGSAMTGSESVVIGDNADGGNGAGNVRLGFVSGDVNTQAGQGNLLLGARTRLGSASASGMERNIVIGYGAGRSLTAGVDDIFVVETLNTGTSGALRSIFYADMNAGNIVIGNSQYGTNRDFATSGVTNALKLIYGTRGTGNPANGGFFYMTAANGLYFVRQNGEETRLTPPAGTLAVSLTGYSNGAGAAAGTLTNAPAAGDPTKWIPVDDNGTTRYIPAW